MIHQYELGEGYTKLSKRLEVSISTVRNVVRKWKATGTVLVKERCGRSRKISEVGCPCSEAINPDSETICKEEWSKIPAVRIQGLISGYKKHLHAVISAKGGSTQY